MVEETGMEIQRRVATPAETAAHELANAAAALSARAELAERRAQRGANIDVAPLLAGIARDAGHLARLSSKILDGRAGVEAGDRKECDLSAALRSSVDRASTVSRRYIRLRAPLRRTRVEVDADELEAVIDNLLTNAVRYSAPDTHIEVSCTVDHTKREAIVRVRDHGIGLASEEHERVFEPFYRSRAARDLSPGTGIGLAVVKAILERYGGKVWLDSTSPAGSTFAFRMPLARRSRTGGQSPR